MMCKFFVSLISLLPICTSIFGQHNFDSIKVCHSKEGELRNLVIGEYNVDIRNGELYSLSSKDNAVKYESGQTKLTIKNLNKNSFLKLQLSNEGVIVDTRDTSFLLNSPKSVGLSSKGDEGVEALYSIGDFSFALEFKQDRISKVSFATTGKYLAIELVQIRGTYTWDFTIESTNHTNTVLLTYTFNKPYLLSINDDNNKVGIRLLSKKKDGVFTLLEGQKIYGKNSFSSDNSYNLQYTKRGRLKKNKSGFNLSCQGL